MGVEYYDASYNSVVAPNGYSSNGWAPYIQKGETKNLVWDISGGYGSNVKYVKLSLAINTTYSAISGVVSNFRVTSEAQNRVGVRVNVTNSVEITTLKYLWSKQSTGITESQVTNTFTNGSLITAPFGAQGTYYLWILVKDVAGNTYLKAVDDIYRDTIKIDNPQIELSVSSTVGGIGKVVNVYSFNAENVYKNYTPWSSNGGTVEKVESRYIGSVAFKLKKYANEAGQWHGLQGSYGNEFSGLAANTYVIVSSDYKTTNSAGVKSFDGNSLWRSDWSYSFETTSILNNLSINQDGNWNHSSVIIKTNEATDSSGVIVHSGMPTWNKSLVAGEMYIDGIQWFTIPEANLNDNIAVKKWAVGNQTKQYFRENGNTYTGNEFATTTNGTHTVYMRTTNGMEITKTFEVSGIVDKLSPEVSIDLNGTPLTSDPTFKNGLNGVITYNNLYNGNVTLTRVRDASIPNNSGYKLHIKTTGTASPDHGGFYFANQTAANEIYVTKIIAKIPVGYSIQWKSNDVGLNAGTSWLTSQEGTGDWKTYIFYLKTGDSAPFGTTNFFCLSGGSTATESAPVEWDVAYAQVYKNSLMNWSNQNVTLTGSIKDELSGTVAYAWTRTATLPTSWTTISATTENVTTTYTATENGRYYLWTKDSAGNVSMIATAIDRINKTTPTVSRAIERSVHTDFSAWIFTGGAYVDGSGNLVLPSVGARVASSYIPVDSTKWLLEFDYTPGGGEGRTYFDGCRIL